MLIGLSVSAITCFAGIALAEPGDYGNDHELTRLKNGEILLQTIHGDKPGGAARVTALFHTSAEAVWNILGYCKYELIYVRGLKSCEVLTPGQTRMLVHHSLRSSWYTPTLDFTFAASRSPDHTGEAHLVSGDLKTLEGFWKMIPLAGDNLVGHLNVLVVHEIRVQPKFPAPRWLVRRSLRKDLPGMMACIRGLAKASGNSSLIAADLRRCPGEISSPQK